MWVGISTDARGYLSAGVYVVVIFPLYFGAGRLFLHNPHNILISVLSVIALFIIIVAIIFVAYDSMFERVLRAPFYLIGGLISHVLQVEQKYIFVVMAALPPFAMWGGLMTKQ